MTRESWNARESVLDDFENYQSDRDRVGVSMWPSLLVGLAVGWIWFGHFTWIRLAFLVVVLVVAMGKESGYPKELRILARRALAAQVAETQVAEAKVIELEGQLSAMRDND